MSSAQRQSKISLVDGKGRPLGSIDADLRNCTVGHLKKLVYKATDLAPARQRLSVESNGKWIPIADTAGQSFGRLQVKDMGPQIGWRTVFFVEYLGPLLIHAIYYLRAQPQQLVQRAAFWLVTIHFLKRELETLLVHRFSHETMPQANLFKNCAHYWLLSGVLLAHQLYKPAHSKPPSSMHTLVWSSAMLVFEVANGITHLNLRSLRPANTSRRAIPYGLGFSLVSCPNYLFEALAWTSFALLTRVWSAWLFTAVAAAQMYAWARKKHARYLKEFGAEYAKLRRKAMFPFVA